MMSGQGKSGAHEAVAAEKYRPLKKLMKKSFAALRESCEQGRWPAPAAVEAFLAEAQAMISYPGFGDEFYPDFGRVCAELRAAHQAQDLPAFAEGLARMRARKKECHARFK